MNVRQLDFLSNVPASAAWPDRYARCDFLCTVLCKQASIHDVQRTHSLRRYQITIELLYTCYVASMGSNQKVEGAFQLFPWMTSPPDQHAHTDRRPPSHLLNVSHSWIS